MPYPQDLIDEVLKSADIVSVISSYGINVIEKGRSNVAICPFHNDFHPSMQISRDKQIFKCFACGTGGNAITFVKLYEKIDFDAAVRKVAEISGFHDERLLKEVKIKKVDSNLVPIYKCIDDLAKYYCFSLNTEEAKKAREYLDARHLDAQIVSKYEIGYSPEDGEATIKFLQAKGHSLRSIEQTGIAFSRVGNLRDGNAGRLIFPLHDRDGQVVGFSARQLEKDGSPKYINSVDGAIFRKGNVLYNYHRVKPFAPRDGYCYVLEGFMDVMALDKAGINSAVATMGTALTDEHIKMLKRLNCEIRLCLDGDDAGQTGMMKITSQLQKAKVPFRIVSNPGDLRDPDEILQEDGPEALKEKMNNLVDAFDFQMNYYLNTKKLETSDEKKRVLAHFIPLLFSVPAGIERDNYIVKLSKATGYETESIYMEMARQKKSSKTNTSPVIEEATFQHRDEENRLKRGLNSLTRLERAEQMALHFMFESEEARQFFLDEIKSFKTKVYEEVANFLLEYAEEIDGKEKIDGYELISRIEASGLNNSDEIRNEAMKVSDETNEMWLPYKKSELENCKNIIEAESKKRMDKLFLEKSLEGKSAEDKARIMNTAAKNKYRNLKNSKANHKEDE